MEVEGLGVEVVSLLLIYICVPMEENGKREINREKTRVGDKRENEERRAITSTQSTIALV